jgi:hypothetical protein
MLPSKRTERRDKKGMRNKMRKEREREKVIE